jgi:hypothetical protein
MPISLDTMRQTGQLAIGEHFSPALQIECGLFGRILQLDGQGHLRPILGQIEAWSNLQEFPRSCIGIDVAMERRCRGPKILGAQAFPQVLSLICPLDQNRVDENQAVPQQLATVLQSPVGRLKKSGEILKLWSAQSRCRGVKTGNQT